MVSDKTGDISASGSDEMVADDSKSVPEESKSTSMSSFNQAIKDNEEGSA